MADHRYTKPPRPGQPLVASDPPPRRVLLPSVVLHRSPHVVTAGQLRITAPDGSRATVVDVDLTFGIDSAIEQVLHQLRLDGFCSEDVENVRVQLGNIDQKVRKGLGAVLPSKLASFALLHEPRK